MSFLCFVFMNFDGKRCRIVVVILLIVGTNFIFHLARWRKLTIWNSCYLKHWCRIRCCCCWCCFSRCHHDSQYDNMLSAKNGFEASPSIRRFLEWSGIHLGSYQTWSLMPSIFVLLDYDDVFLIVIITSIIRCLNHCVIDLFWIRRLS
jgi:hypothetical protein